MDVLYHVVKKQKYGYQNGYSMVSNRAIRSSSRCTRLFKQLHFICRDVASLFSVLGEFFSPDDLEAYSIDECFIRLTPYLQSIDIHSYCAKVVETLESWLSLPCCIGIGYSKTQAKLANHYAKKIPSFNKICNFITLDPLLLEDLMQHTSVKEVWGIGYQLVKQLRSYEIYSC